MTNNIMDKDNTKEEVPQEDIECYIVSGVNDRGNMYKENQCGSSFSADQDYQDQFLYDIYSPDDHNTKQNFQEKFHSILRDITYQFKKFSYLRSFDMCLISCGDHIFANKKTTPYIVDCRFRDGRVLISDSDSPFLIHEIKDLKPYEKYAYNTLVKDRVELYDIIYRKIKDSGFDYKFYFYVFCDYFKIQDFLEFFCSLPVYHQCMIEKSYRKRRL